jgi:hypothetical protein
MLESVSNCGKRGPNTSHAAARTSFCKNTLGGTDVASETRAAAGIVYRSSVVAIRRTNIRAAAIFRRLAKNGSPNGSLKIEAHLSIVWMRSLALVLRLRSGANSAGYLADIFVGRL